MYYNIHWCILPWKYTNDMFYENKQNLDYTFTVHISYLKYQGAYLITSRYPKFELSGYRE